MKRKIAIITRENAIGNVTLNALIPRIIDLGYSPVLYVVDDPSSHSLPPSLARAAYIETGLYRDVIAPFLMQFPLMVQGRFAAGLNYTLAQIAFTHGLESVRLKGVNAQDFAQTIERRHDIIGGISVRNLQIFTKPIIDAFESKKDGFLWNLHPGILPDYKGLYIPFRVAQKKGEAIGQSLHHVDRGIDTGHILGKSTVPFDPHSPVFESYMNMAGLGADLIIREFKAYQQNGLRTGWQQTEKERSIYYPMPSEAEMQALAQQGTVFAQDEDVARIYTKYFSKDGTHHAASMTKIIGNALQRYDDRAASVLRRA